MRVGVGQVWVEMNLPGKLAGVLFLKRVRVVTVDTCTLCTGCS